VLEAIKFLDIQAQGRHRSCWLKNNPEQPMLYDKYAPQCRSLQHFKLLLVSPDNEDRLFLERLLNDVGSTAHADANWSVVQCEPREPAVTTLKLSRIPIVVWDNDLAKDCWRELLWEWARLPDPPLLIVTSRLADERLWAEALNLGAWDVLAKPFDREEVARTLNSAWLHWYNRHQSGSNTVRRTAMAAYDSRGASAAGGFLY
jgi:DNA-binding response OmpR family regulator